MPLTRLDQDGPLAVLTLTAPPLNLFTPATVDELRAAVAEVAAGDARGLLLQAEGRAVSGGVDVKTFDGLTPVQAEAMWRDWFGLIHTMPPLRPHARGAVAATSCS